MKKLSLLFLVFIPLLGFAQVNESFSDGNYTTNPVWYSSGSNFTVNPQKQLQSSATTSSTSFISTPSEALDDATWECWVKINYNPSSYNYARIYLAADKNDVITGCNGYYLEIGGNNDEVSLYLQQGTKKTKIIDGADDRTNRAVVEIRINVTRIADGTFTLKSKLSDEADFITEGTVKNNVVRSSKYFGLLYTNSGTTGNAYYFDDIIVTGTKVPDTEAPTWTSLLLEEPNKLRLQFSEEMDFSTAMFTLDHDMGVPEKQEVSVDKMGIELTFASSFEKGKIYTLSATGLLDLAGNKLQVEEKKTGIVEKIAVGDVIFNEVMVENALNSSEYIEFYNRSEKVIDLAGLNFSTRKTDGTINSGIAIPAFTLLAPNEYLAMGENIEIVKIYHHCPPESNLLESNWNALNNETATLVLTNATKDTVYDELCYNVKWHHSLIKNPKGVALERINPYAATQDPQNWHSAASETNYGTPGYKNSQYRELTNETATAKWAWAEPEAFSPDNDGVDDVCLIHYKTDTNGYVANLLILNAVGEKVIQLVTNKLLASEGYIAWDGVNAKMKNANVGIYVVYFELFNPENGIKKQIKFPIVVSSR